MIHGRNRAEHEAFRVRKNIKTTGECRVMKFLFFIMLGVKEREARAC
jgi:hypothetical protein